MSRGIRFVVAGLCLVVGVASILGAEVRVAVDWTQFLARQDLVWNRLPDRWESGAFMGNGLRSEPVLFRRVTHGIFFAIPRHLASRR